MSDDFKELDLEGDVQPGDKKAIINIKDDWPRWFKIVAWFINVVPILLWIGLSVFLLWSYNGDAELASLRDGYMSVTVPAAFYGVITLAAANFLLLWLNPFMNPQAMMKGPPLQQLAGCIYWGLSNLAIALIIFGASL